MMAESLAILIVILVMQAMLVRSDKRDVALLAMPTLSVSLFYLLAAVVGALFDGVDAAMLYPGMVVAGALVGIGGSAALGHFIPNRALKLSYLVLCIVFLVAVAVAYLMRIL